MTATAEKTISIADIDPKNKPSFSPNLYAWCKHNCTFTKDAFGCDVFRVRAGTDAEKKFGADTLLIGYLFDDAFIGSRLSLVLCNGSKQERFSYGGFASEVDKVEGFWESYLEKGRCAIDPDHTTSFSGNQRFHVEGDVRTCLWCGQKHRKNSIEKIVIQEEWVPA